MEGGKGKGEKSQAQKEEEGIKATRSGMPGIDLASGYTLYTMPENCTNELRKLQQPQPKIKGIHKGAVTTQMGPQEKKTFGKAVAAEEYCIFEFFKIYVLFLFGFWF